MASAVAALSSVTLSGVATPKWNPVPDSRSPKPAAAFPSLRSSEKVWARKNSRSKSAAYVTETIFTSEDQTALEKPQKEEEVVESFDSPLIPNMDEIQSLLVELCEDTSITEVQIKIQGFKLRMKRDVGKDSRAPAASSAPAYSSPVYSAPPVPTFPMIDSLSASPAAPQTPAYESEEEEVDEGLQYVSATNVGIFRSGRPRKGKFGRPFVTQGSKVKVGQLVGFIEQLGTNLNVESEHFGEIAEVFVSEGDPIEFGQKLFAIRPSFPGIKKLQ